jgi:hypothetical protein
MPLKTSGYPLRFVSQCRSLLDFTAVKVIFDTSMTIHLRSTPLPHHKITRHTNVCNCVDLVVQYQSVEISTTRRLEESA